MDDYLEFCKAEGRKPDVPLKGSFTVSPGPALHRRAMFCARKQNMSLDDVVSNALNLYLDRNDQTE